MEVMDKASIDYLLRWLPSIAAMFVLVGWGFWLEYRVRAEKKSRAAGQADDERRV